MLIRPPRFVKKLYPSFIWSFEQETDAVFLTFDDGPTPEITIWVLDELDKFDAKATFFCIGKNVEQHPDIFEEIKRRGHSVGNHSYSHIKGWSVKSDEYMGDVNASDDLIKSNLYRPPYGKISLKQAKKVSERFNVIMWSILSRDYNRNLSGRQCAQNVLKYISPGAIIVFHDSDKCKRNLKYALPIVLEEMKKRNLRSNSIIL